MSKAGRHDSRPRLLIALQWKRTNKMSKAESLQLTSLTNYIEEVPLLPFLKQFFITKCIGKKSIWT